MGKSSDEMMENYGVEATEKTQADAQKEADKATDETKAVAEKED